MNPHKFNANEKIFIIAGNYDEYKDWVQKNMMRLWSENQSLSLSNFVYVDSVDKLRGRKEVHGFFVGSYANRTDLQKIKDYIDLVNCFPYAVKSVVKNVGSLLDDGEWLKTPVVVKNVNY